MRLGPLFRGTFEVQAGNRPLQGQSKPPVFTGGYDYYRCGMVSRFYKNILLSSEKACILISASGTFPNPYSAKMNGMPASLHALASP